MFTYNLNPWFSSHGFVKYVFLSTSLSYPLFLHSSLPSPAHFPFPSFSVLPYVKDACYVNVLFNEWLEGNKKEKKESFEKKITSLNSLVNQICILLSLFLSNIFHSLILSFLSLFPFDHPKHQQYIYTY